MHETQNEQCIMWIISWLFWRLPCVSLTIVSVYQAMIIIAWHQRISSNAIFDDDVLQSVSSIFVTAAIFNFLQGNFELSCPECYCY